MRSRSFDNFCELENSDAVLLSQVSKTTAHSERRSTSISLTYELKSVCSFNSTATKLPAAARDINTRIPVAWPDALILYISLAVDFHQKRVHNRTWYRKLRRKMKN